MGELLVAVIIKDGQTWTWREGDTFWCTSPDYSMDYYNMDSAILKTGTLTSESNCRTFFSARYGKYASIPYEAELEGCDYRMYRITSAKKKPQDTEFEFKNDILEERQKSYGDPVEMHERIAKIWSGILNVQINANEVALCMIGLKLARSQNDPSHLDSLVDVAGYNEIAQLIQESKNKE